MAKKVAGIVKFQLQAGAATPAYPVGPALGQYGANIMGFVKEFNAATANQGGAVVPVEITIYADRSFTFITKTPPATFLIKQAAGIGKGSGVPKKDKVGSITWEQCIELGRKKMADLHDTYDEAKAHSIAVSALSI